jgi:uncharacterized protein YpmS
MDLQNTRNKLLFRLLAILVALVAVLGLLVFTSSGNKDAVILAKQKREILTSASSAERLSETRKKEIYFCCW